MKSRRGNVIGVSPLLDSARLPGESARAAPVCHLTYAAEYACCKYVLLVLRPPSGSTTDSQPRCARRIERRRMFAALFGIHSVGN
ncbi:MAG: hypothetical protein AAF961_03190 [Planctomycetota bacterium]